MLRTAATVTWVVMVASLTMAASVHGQATWYETSFFLLHEDHHTSGRIEVGRDADREQISELLAALRPDMIQIHAKGNPGWTTYPSHVGYTPPKLARDVLGLWRDLARQNGFHWSVYYNIGRDGEIMQRHPEWNRDVADGREQDKALCYHSGVADAYIWPMLEEIIRGYDPDGFWFDGSVFTVRVCYCTACRQRFRTEQGADLPRSPEAPKWHEFHAMQRAIYREFIAATCRRIHMQKPSCLVTFNWAYSLRMPEKPDPRIAYLTGDIGNHVEGLSAEAHGYDGTGLPFDLMTTGHTFALNDDGRAQRIPKPRPQLEQEMAIIIANGGRYNLWDNPSPTSRIDPVLLRHHSRVVTPFLRARQPWCAETQRVPDVSVLHSAAAHYSLAEKGEMPFKRQNNRIDGLAQFLPQLHLNYEILGDWRLLAQDVRSPFLIVEHPRALSPPEINALLTFAEKGGQVLMTGMGLTLRGDLPKNFGLNLLQAPVAAEPLEISLGGQAMTLEHYLFRYAPAGCTVLAEARDREGKAHPFLTRQVRGKGVLWTLATPFFSAHGSNTPTLELMRQVMESVLPSEQRNLAVDAPKSVEVVLRRHVDGTLIYHVVNAAQGARTLFVDGQRQQVMIHDIPPVSAHRVAVRVPTKPTSVTIEPGGSAVTDWAFRDGLVSFTMPATDIHAMAVIR